MNIILHIGQPKTGSSSIQRFLYANKNTLETLGYYYDTYDEISGKNIPKQDFVSHIKMIRLLRTEPNKLKEYINKKILEAESKYLHTIIFSSEDLFGFYSQGQIKHLVHFFPYPIKTVVFLKRQDLYLESSWQQWGFKNSNTITEYLYKEGIPNYLKLLRYWEQSTQELVVTYFEKKSFPQGLEKYFLHIIGINDYKNFNFNYLSSDDSWGANKGLTPKALNIAILCRDLIDVYKDDFIIHKFINTYLSEIFEKEHFSKNNFLTVKQRSMIMQKMAADNKEIAKHYFDNKRTFESINYEEYKEPVNEVSMDTIVRMLIKTGITKNQKIDKLKARVEYLQRQ